MNNILSLENFLVIQVQDVSLVMFTLHTLCRLSKNVFTVHPSDQKGIPQFEFFS